MTRSEDEVRRLMSRSSVDRMTDSKRDSRVSGVYSAGVADLPLDDVLADRRGDVARARGAAARYEE